MLNNTTRKACLPPRPSERSYKLQPDVQSCLQCARDKGSHKLDACVQCSSLVNPARTRCITCLGCVCIVCGKIHQGALTAAGAAPSFTACVHEPQLLPCGCSTRCQK